MVSDPDTVSLAQAPGLRISWIISFQWNADLKPQTHTNVIRSACRSMTHFAATYLGKINHEGNGMWGPVSKSTYSCSKQNQQQTRFLMKNGTKNIWFS